MDRHLHAWSVSRARQKSGTFSTIATDCRAIGSIRCSRIGRAICGSAVPMASTDSRTSASPTLRSDRGFPEPDVSSLLAARDGSVWVATLGGVGRLKAARLTLIKAESGPEDSPEQAQSFSDSQVHTIVDRALPSSNISSLYENSKGRLWAYTRAGLAYFQNGHFTRVTTEPLSGRTGSRKTGQGYGFRKDPNSFTSAVAGSNKSRGPSWAVAIGPRR